MKIKDIVFLVQDRTIVKTRIDGIKQLREPAKYDDKEKIVTTYLVNDGQSRQSGDSDSWYEAKDLIPTLDEAQKEIQKRIEQEILEEREKISIVDTTHV